MKKCLLVVLWKCVKVNLLEKSAEVFEKPPSAPPDVQRGWIQKPRCAPLQEVAENSRPQRGRKLALYITARSCCFVMHSIWQKRGFQAAFENRFASCTKEGIFLLVSLGFDAAMFLSLSLSLSSLYVSNSYTHRLIKLSCEACHIATFRNEVKLCAQKLKA